MKKLILVAVVGFVAVAALKNTKWGSYVRSELHGAKKWADEQVPPEKEVGRLRSELKALDKDLMAVVEKVAQERVECDRLRTQLDDLKAKQVAFRKQIDDRAAAIRVAEQKGAAQVSYNSRTDDLPAAKVALENWVRQYTANEKSIKSVETTLGNRERVKEGWEKQLEGLKVQKVEIAAEIDAVEAELAELAAQQVGSRHQTDDTRLARIKESLRGLKTRTAVEKEKLKLMPAAFDAPAPAAAGKTVDEILAPLAPQGKPEAKVPASTD